MKILHIIDSGGLYGAEMVLLSLVAEQIKMGLHPEIASIGEKGIDEKPLETAAIKRGFKVVKFRMFPGPNLYGMLKVLHYARRNKFDILHSHGYKGDVAFGLMPKNLRKLPLISTLHGWTSINGVSKNAIYEWLQRQSLRRMDAVVLVHKGMLSHPKLKNINGVNFHVVNNGIPMPDSPFNDLTDPQLDQSIINFCQRGFTIGSIGRLSTEKGYRYLVEAFALLIQKGIDSRLVIIGEGYERHLIEELVAKHKLKGSAMLPGYRDMAKQYLPYFNVFVLSSLTEGLPVTLLEAMQANVPIVATRVGGITDVLGNDQAGVLVQPKNSVALAEAISKIHNNGELASQLAAAAGKTFQERYSSATMTSDYKAVYKAVIEEYQYV